MTQINKDQNNDNSDWSDPTRTFRILIADDEEDARTLIGVALDRKNMEIVFARDGAEAIEICEKQLPDLAVLDIQMPHRSGIDVCNWIKQGSAGRFIPVLLLTSQSETYDKVHGLNCGADDYITKPFSFAELAARVNAFLRIKVLTEQLSETRNLLAEKEKELVAVQVAGAAAHELGQPLTTIVLNCELLNSLSSGTEKFQEVLRNIGVECQRVRDTLSRLNAVEKYRVKPYTGDLQILDLNQD